MCGPTAASTAPPQDKAFLWSRRCTARPSADGCPTRATESGPLVAPQLGWPACLVSRDLPCLLSALETRALPKGLYSATVSACHKSWVLSFGTFNTQPSCAESLIKAGADLSLRDGVRTGAGVRKEGGD